MSDHPLKDVIPTFDNHSFHAGIIMAFAEVVGAGCKKLALSSPYPHDFAKEMKAVAEFGAKKRNVIYYYEDDLLVSKLFRPDVAKDKTVIILVQNQKVLDEYLELKTLKKESNSKGNPDELENEIVRRFGKLLSYDEASIKRLQEKNG